MTRGKHYLDRYERGDDFRKIEKIKKEKRSVRGRTEDDWLLDFSKLSEKEAHEELEKYFKKNLRRGRVIEVQKRNIFIAEENDEGLPVTERLWLCSIAKRHFQRAHRERNFVVVGDRILFQPDLGLALNQDGQPTETDLPRGVIQHAFTRTSRIARKDPLNPDWEHIMLANIDLIVIVASVLNPEVRWGLIDRFLVQAELEGILPVIVLNKIDLLSDEKLATPEFFERYRRRVADYRRIGYEVIEVCALRPRKTLSAVRRLREIFRGKIVGFAGHSGVGKSSVLNLMQPEFEQIVDENPEIFYKGRHTTTYNSLLALGIGAYAIDTPGIRSFHIDQPNPVVLSSCFREFREYTCKYRECAHDREHDLECEIKQAVTAGEISLERYRSYLGILKGISFREGETNDNSDAILIADFQARQQKTDEENS